MHVLTKASLFALAFAPSRNFVASAQPSSSSSSSSSMFGGNGVNFAEREGPVKCTVILIEPYMVDPDAEETSTVACMLHPEYEGDSISGITYELYTPSFPHDFFEDVEYATTDLTISAALIKTAGGRGKHGGGVIFMKNGATATKEWRGKGKGKGNNNGGGLRSSSIAENSGMMFANRTTGRRLAQTTGNSTLIVLYAVPLDASNIDRTPTQLANDVFGIAVNETQDLVNARSQVLSCSGGKLSYIPACGTPEQSCSSNVNQSIWFKNGVLRVPIPYNVTGIASGTVKNWVEAEAQKILQAQTPKIDLYSFTQIMNVIPDAADWGGAAAWAYLPGQTSAFRSSYSFVMGVIVHEFGHNIGLHHSGFGTAAYADHSCLLGNPSYGDDGPAICFNGAKSWETGWYATDSVDVVPSSTVLFTADLIGAADWSTGTYTPGSHRVVLRITDSTVTQKYHIMYNRAKGPNAGVTFAKDKVTVTLGAPQQVSWHQAALGPVNAAGNVYPVFRKEKFNGGNKTLVIKLCSTTAGNATAPDTANVMVYLDDGVAFNNGFMCPNEVPCINDSGCNDNNFCTQNTCVNNTCMPPVDISATQCPSCGNLTYCNPSGTCDRICTDNNQCTADACVADTCQHDPIPGCAVPGATLETWLNIPGSSVTDLTNNVAYQNPPNQVADILGSLATPKDRADNFGARLRTYIMPTVNGTYTFYVASDDSSELWLSTNHDPANKVLRARVDGWTGDKVWTAYASQKSSPVNLTAGASYFLEALYKEGGGGDHLSVGWESTNAGVSLDVINGSSFYKYPPVPCTSNGDCLSTNPCTSGQCNPSSTLCEYRPIFGCVNGAKLETWLGISGSLLSSLKTNSRYPNSPNTSVILNNILEAPSNRADNFGARMLAYITPPVTCNYTFYIASDDEGELHLSNNTNPINKVKIAYVSGWAGPREWNKYLTQKSSPVPLEKGKLYYMEALYKEGGGGDNLAIAWECLLENIALEVIGSVYTSVALPGSTSSPTTSPSKGPTKLPTNQPSTKPPSLPPTNAPSNQPSSKPTTSMPTGQPSSAPTESPLPAASPTTESPTSESPTTESPTSSPTTESPTTENPTSSPTTESPATESPTSSPTTESPTTSPTTESPTSESPTSESPTSSPTTESPTSSPTTERPTSSPTTESPTTQSPTTESPTTESPTMTPSKNPTMSPTESPTSFPTKAPVSPTVPPSAAPTQSPTTPPSMSPTNTPSKTPTMAPTRIPTASPTTGAPTNAPTNTPSKAPTRTPTKFPTMFPTTKKPTTCAVASAPCSATTPCCTGLRCPTSGAKKCVV